jgi:hypothetical protein
MTVLSGDSRGVRATRVEKIRLRVGQHEGTTDSEVTHTPGEVVTRRGVVG